MYTGVGCTSCRSTGLGILPVVAAAIAQEAPTILNDIKSLFTGSSYDKTHQQILAWVQLILSDPTQALSGHYTSAQGPTTPANAWLELNGWAANPVAYQTWLSVGGVPLSGNAPLGCESSHGCLADAQAAVRHLEQQFNLPAAFLAPAGTRPPSGAIAPPAVSLPGSTIYTPLPGGGGLNLPVPASSLFGATIAGVPVLLLVGGALVLAFAGGSRRRGA